MSSGIPCGACLPHHKPQLTTAIWVKVKGGEPRVSLVRRSAMVGDGYRLDSKIGNDDGYWLVSKIGNDG